MTRKQYFRLGPNQQKILLLLASGLALGLAGTPGSYFKIIRGASKEWQVINDISLKRAIRSLYRSKLIKEYDNSDGSTTMILTEKGKEKALTFDIDNIIVKKPKYWDGKWRVVLFDIPEKRKPAREALRKTLKRLGFYEFQKSVLVHPYECQDELDYVIEFFHLRPYVRTMRVVALDNEAHLKNIFKV